MSNKIQRIIGILNGTTNFILTEMIEKNKDFDEALCDAQNKGYAERDPSADIEGHDASRKLAILSSLAWSEYVNYKDIETEGITKITLEDVKYADKFGYVIKLIGYAEKKDKLLARVAPMLVSKQYPLSGVCGVFNAIVVKGNYLGTSMFYGRGAGKFPTASAVVADVIDSVRHLGAKKQYLEWNPAKEDYMMPCADAVSKYFVRSSACKEQIESLFGNVSFEDGVKAGETGFITEPMSEKEFLEKARMINAESFIRVLEA